MAHESTPGSTSWSAGGRGGGVGVADPDATQHPATTLVVPPDIPWRWVAMGVFALASFLNFLDRQLLAAVAPSVMAEFGLTNADYGTLVAAFAMMSLVMAPVAGLLVDRVGLNVAAMLAVTSWSLAAASTGLASSLRGLIGCRMWLGMSEAAGLPCASKATATYLPAREFGLGTAVQSIGISGGSIAAPLLAAAIAPRYGWRMAFVVGGALGLLWVPIWWFTSRKVPSRAVTARAARTISVTEVLRDTRLWGILVTNALLMSVQSMWVNWTTIYFVQVHGLTQTEANQYFAWIPPVFGTIGGLFGASLALKLSANRPPLHARLRVCGIFPPILLVTALVPLMPSPVWAAFAISVSYFFGQAVLMNVHVLPIDIFGAERAAFTSALQVSAFAVMQMIVAPAMGRVADGYGFGVLCGVVALLPIAAMLILRVTVTRRVMAES